MSRYCRDYLNQHDKKTVRLPESILRGDRQMTQRLALPRLEAQFLLDRLLYVLVAPPPLEREN